MKKLNYRCSSWQVWWVNGSLCPNYQISKMAEVFSTVFRINRVIRNSIFFQLVWCLRSRQSRKLYFLFFPMVVLFLVCSFQLLSWIYPTPSWLGFWSLVSSRNCSMYPIYVSWKLCLMTLPHWIILVYFCSLSLIDGFYILLTLFSLLFLIFCSSMLLLASFRLWGWFLCCL